MASFLLVKDFERGGFAFLSRLDGFGDNFNYGTTSKGTALLGFRESSCQLQVRSRSRF
jgi:hypothetical protein